MPLERRIQRTRQVVAATTALSVVALALASFVLIRQSKSDAVRTADRKAAAVAQVSACYQQVDNAPKVLKLLGLIRSNSNLLDLLATSSIKANTQAIAATPGDPLNKIRQATIDRLTDPRNQLRADAPALDTYIAATRSQAPTDPDCRRLAQQLGVNPDRPRQKGP